MAVTVKKVELFDNYEFMGLSTDDKPTEDVNVNSLFLELDTGDFYYFDGTDWNKVGGGGSGPDENPLA